MENNELLKKKISIGLSLSMTLYEYKKILIKYKDYIHSLYFSPPINGNYHSRLQIAEQFKNSKNVEHFYEIIELMKENGVKLDLVLNTPRITEEAVIGAFDIIDKLNVEQITCLDRHIDLLFDEFPKKEFIYSYNNDFNMNKLTNISKKFSTIVLGKYFIRNIKYLEAIKSSGFKLKLLINNGCSFNCKGCINGTIECENVFNNNLRCSNINELYALQSFYPNELNKLLNQLSNDDYLIKISNRVDGFNYLDTCLDSYINNISPTELIKQNQKNYRLYCRLGWFNEYLDEMNEEEIEKIKKRKANL